MRRHLGGKGVGHLDRLGEQPRVRKETVELAIWKVLEGLNETYMVRGTVEKVDAVEGISRHVWRMGQASEGLPAMTIVEQKPPPGKEGRGPLWWFRGSGEGS